MKFINELTEGEKVESVFAVAEKQLRTTRAGKAFIQMKLSDKTGACDAVVWDNAEALAQKFEKGDFIGVRADVNLYNGAKQLNVQVLKRVEKTPEYMARFMPTSERDVDEMVSELVSIASTIKNAAIRKMVEDFLGDEDMMARFKKASAAKGMHHVFSGGLLQHSLKVTRLCLQTYDEYATNDPMIASMMNRDLLVAGAMMHDVGKVEELSDGPNFDYTFRGRLIGHVSLGLMELEKRLSRTPGIDPEHADLLMHMLISHHGELEYGSPKRPKCMEAFILHYADNLDAKLQGLAEYADKDTMDGKFTAFHRLYERYFYKGNSNGNEDADTE